jgi:hypothetical protein
LVAETSFAQRVMGNWPGTGFQSAASTPPTRLRVKKIRASFSIYPLMRWDDKTRGNIVDPLANAK